MYYITVRQPPSYHQMTLEEFLFGCDVKTNIINENLTNTRTYEVESVSEVFKQRVNVNNLIEALEEFNRNTERLHEKPRQELYRTFFIPKKSGGLRRIDAPESELMDALRRLKTIFEEDFGALYHTSAFAYIKRRSTIDCLKKHQMNESKWFGKYDLHDFFGSTTPEYVIKMFSMIFPFCEVMKTERGANAFKTAIDLAFLNGGLPQGTPISPTITNIMMIPVDFKLANSFRDFESQTFVYTRYADDFQISSRYTFSFRRVENEIKRVLKEFDAPFTINSKKTRYGSSAGSNWNLGIMLNQDNELTVGYKKKKQFQAMLFTYVQDKKNGVNWNKGDVQILDGYRNYYKMVEGKTIDNIIEHFNQKNNCDVERMLAADLKYL